MPQTLIFYPYNLAFFWCKPLKLLLFDMAVL